MPTPTALTTTPTATVRPLARPGGRAPARSRRAPSLVPVVVGLALGPVDLLLQHVLPYPFANLANSSPGVGAGRLRRRLVRRVRGRWWPAVAGTLTLLLAVEGYYLTAVLRCGRRPVDARRRPAPRWPGWSLAVAAGVVFGTAGAWARSAHPWRGPLGTAAAVAVVLAEAWLDLTRLSGAGTTPPTATTSPRPRSCCWCWRGRRRRGRPLGPPAGVGSVLALGLALVGALAISTLRRTGA